MSEFDGGPGQHSGKQHRGECSQQCRTGTQTDPVGQIDRRIEDRCRRDQCHRQCRSAISQCRQHEDDQHTECDHDACERPQAPPAGHRDDDECEYRGQQGQRPGALIIVKPVACRALLVDLAEYPNMVARHQIRLSGTWGEFQQRVRAGVGSGVDGDHRLHAGATAGHPGCRPAGEHFSGRGASAVCSRGRHHVTALGGDRSACAILERHGDVRLVAGRPEQCRPDDHGKSDHRQRGHDDPGGQRAQRCRAGVRMRVRHRLTAGSSPGSCPAVRWHWRDHAPTAGSRCADGRARAS